MYQAVVAERGAQAWACAACLGAAWAREAASDSQCVLARHSLQVGALKIHRTCTQAFWLISREFTARILLIWNLKVHETSRYISHGCLAVPRCWLSKSGGL